MTKFHRRFVNLAVMTDPIISDLNSVPTKTSGDGYFEPAVIGALE
jgi:hypothetical protein